MAIAGTTIPLDSTEGMDKITTTEKITSPYFTNGDAEILAVNIVSSSLSDTNEDYFFGISHKDTATTEEFNVTFGSLNGYGSSDSSTTKSNTEAIYKQYASLLLAPTEVTGGFKISQQGTAGQLSARDEDIYVLVGKRARFKDRMNKGTWTLSLSGSVTAGTAASQLKLTDDSKYNKAQFTVAGPRYNIVSGTAGTVSGSSGAVAKDHRTFGWFYPDAGVLVFSAHELSASMPGVSYTGSAAEFHSNFGTLGMGAIGAGNGDISSSGLAPFLSDSVNANNALKFVNCLRTAGGKATATASEKTTTVLRFRSEEDQTQNNYFCRIRSGALNFSNNPTFTSSSILGNGNVVQQVRNKSMWGNPTVYITGVGLYNNAGKLVAVAKLSTPIKKNFSSEATIKVKLTY